MVILNGTLTSLNRRCRYDRDRDQKTVHMSMRVRIDVLESIMATYCNTCRKKIEILDLRFFNFMAGIQQMVRRYMVDFLHMIPIKLKSEGKQTAIKQQNL